VHQPVLGHRSRRFFDFHIARPEVEHDSDGSRFLVWPTVTLYAPSHGDEESPLVLLGHEPSRLWKSFASQMVDHALSHGVEAIVFLGAMLADVPHSRPVKVTATSDDPLIREHFDIEKSSYEGPVGVLTVLSLAAQKREYPRCTCGRMSPTTCTPLPHPRSLWRCWKSSSSAWASSQTAKTSRAKRGAGKRALMRLASDDDDMSAYIESSRKRGTLQMPPKPKARRSPKNLRSTCKADPTGQALTRASYSGARTPVPSSTRVMNPVPGGR
jgi:hypothetical protein